MDLVHSLVALLQVLSALGVIVLVLLQHGKGADMGAAFGGGASGSLFGATGSANFMSRLTAGLATVFLLCTLGLAFITNKPQMPASVMEQPASGDASIPSVSAPAVPAAPAVPNQDGAAAPAAPDAAQKNGSSSGIPK